MRPLLTIDGPSALARLGVVVILEVLVFLVITRLAIPLAAIAIIAIFAVLAGSVVAFSFALLPWMLQRAERRVWEDARPLDQAALLEASGLEKAPARRRREWVVGVFRR